MKIKAKALLFAAAALLASVNQSHGALVAAWDADDNANWRTNGNPAVETHARVTVSGLIPHGNVVQQSTHTYNGWSTSINPDDYVGFSVKANEGYELNLTNLLYAAVNHGGFSWKYRIDDGSGFGSWIDLESRGVGNYLGDLTFAQPIVTTGTVEFGWFAAASNTTRAITFWAPNGSRPDELVLSGSVNAVPEPSAVLLSGLGCLALTARRRRKFN